MNGHISCNKDEGRAKAKPYSKRVNKNNMKSHRSVHFPAGEK
jgi:hypothetical protein